MCWWCASCTWRACDDRAGEPGNVGPRQRRLGSAFGCEGAGDQPAHDGDAHAGAAVQQAGQHRDGHGG
ncbi:MAG: hypothetical protein AB7O88_09840 [Reyranellaceae bacterium]